MKGGVRLLLSVGHGVGRLLLYPTCAYFLSSSRQARAASRDYLNRVLGRPARFLDVARHYLTFAKTLHDRVYFLAGRTGEFTIEKHGLELVEQTLAKGKGCLLLGAHLGSFEVLRVLARDAQDSAADFVSFAVSPDGRRAISAARGTAPSASRLPPTTGAPSASKRA